MAEKYDNPTKDTWRGWAWNQISERMGKSYSYRPKTVCVLAGSIAADLRCAAKHNVNCVGVDFDSDCVACFRDSGGVAVQDSLQNQIFAMQPNGVIADLLCGCTPGAGSMLLDSIAASEAVVFNFLRGRDKGIQRFPSEVPDYTKRQPCAVEVGKHRGRIAISIAGKLINELYYGASREDYFVPDKIWDKLRPSYYSYKSKDGGQFFDSVAVSCGDFGLTDSGKKFFRMQAPEKSKRKAAAAKALMTMARNKKPKKTIDILTTRSYI